MYVTDHKVLNGPRLTKERYPKLFSNNAMRAISTDEPRKIRRLASLYAVACNDDFSDNMVRMLRVEGLEFGS